MDYLGNIWQAFINFLAEYDSRKIATILQAMDWQEVMRNPWAWCAGVPVLAYLLWKRHFHTLLLFVSLVLFGILVVNTLPGPGQSIPLNKILTFIGGSVALVGVNLYFFLVRG
jgi:hypothetical protein